VGDVILIETGKTVPADCVLIQSNDLSLSESVITGESEPVYKANVTQENYSSNPSHLLCSQHWLSKAMVAPLSALSVSTHKLARLIALLTFKTT